VGLDAGRDIVAAALRGFRKPGERMVCEFGRAGLIARINIARAIIAFAGRQIAVWTAC